MDLCSFPVEVIWHIAHLLDFRDLYNLEETNSYLKYIFIFIIICVLNYCLFNIYCIIRDVIDNVDFWKQMCANELNLNPHYILSDNISKETYHYLSSI